MDHTKNNTESGTDNGAENESPATLWRGRRLGFLGAGQMAEALARGAVGGGLLPASSILAVDPLDERRAVFAEMGCRVDREGAALAGCDVVVLAVKPQQAARALEDLAGIWKSSTLLVSVMAGVRSEKIGRHAGAARVVRAMPNLPLVAGAGATAVAPGPRAGAGDMRLALALFEAGGRAWPVEEDWLDAVTALSGSGPAYVFRMAEALALAGRAAGLPMELAEGLARETVWGAAKLMRDSGESAARLRERVTSPGGTTAAGLAALDRPDGGGASFSALLGAAVSAAAARGRELAGE